MKRCAECRGDLVAAETDDEIQVGEHRLVLKLPAQRCSKCGENYVDGKAIERAELFVASQLLGLGISTGAAFRFMRKALGIRGADLAELLDVNAATVSRWENDAVPVDRAAIATLAAAASERLAGSEATLERLRALRAGKHPAKTVRLNYSSAA